MGEILRKIFVIGVGNYLLGDEGVGIHVVNKLREVTLPSCVEVVDGGVGGLFLLEFFEKAEKVILIDAVLGGGKPGDVYVLRAKELEESGVKSLTSSHDVDIQMLVKVAREMEVLPELFLVGVEPKNYREIGINLSREVEEAMPKVIEIILKLVNDC
ncbi:MAG: hydrogenase maturation protease [Candidatus Jordarchaeales archaeon]